MICLLLQILELSEVLFKIYDSIDILDFSYMESAIDQMIKIDVKNSFQYLSDIT